MHTMHVPGRLVHAHVLFMRHMIGNLASCESPESGPAREQAEQLAVELIRALRGRRSRAELSRRAGYGSNIVQRWESRQCFPTAARYLQLHARLRPSSTSWVERYFKTLPAWALGLDACSPEAVACFLEQLRGSVPLTTLAAQLGRSRFTLSRWLSGRSEPKLPEFLEYCAIVGRRLVDLAAVFEEPTRLPSIRSAWERLALARRAAYELPWSHAVLRALEVAGAPRGVSAQKSWLSNKLSVSVERIEEALEVLLATGQVQRTRAGYRLSGRGFVVNTSDDPKNARRLRASWIRTALERIDDGSSGRYGYSLFAISESDLAKLQRLHLDFVRQMQQVIAQSEPSECVGLYCSQLLNLSGPFPERP